MKTNSPGSFFMIPAICLGLCFAVNLSAQVSNPNTIRGEVRFTNTNPEILSVLDAPGNEGLRYIYINAHSVISPTHPTRLDNKGSFSAQSKTVTPYTLQVEAGLTGNGIVYKISGTLALQNWQDYYHLKEAITAPIEQQPADAVHVDINECVGMVRVRWVDQNGNPLSVSGGRLVAREQLTNWVQANSNFSSGTETHLAVAGGGTYDFVLTTRLTTDSDANSDLISFSDSFSETLTVFCDELVTLTRVLKVGTGGGSGPLDSITGNVDMLNYTELAISGYNNMGR